MPILKKTKKDQEIKLYVTLSQKNEFKKMAALTKRSISEYILESASSTMIDTGKIDFFQNANDDFVFLKRNQLVIIHALMFLMTKQLDSREKAVEIFKTFVEDAKKNLKK